MEEIGEYMRNVLAIILTIALFGTSSYIVVAKVDTNDSFDVSYESETTENVTETERVADVETEIETTTVEETTAEEITTVEVTTQEETTKKQKAKKHKKEKKTQQETTSVFTSQPVTTKQPETKAQVKKKEKATKPKKEKATKPKVVNTVPKQSENTGGLNSNSISLIKNTIMSNFLGSYNSNMENLARYMAKNGSSDAQGCVNRLCKNTTLKVSGNIATATANSNNTEDILEAAEKLADSLVGSGTYGVGISVSKQNGKYKITAAIAVQIN
jgi:hypothetical protein